MPTCLPRSLPCWSAALLLALAVVAPRQATAQDLVVFAAASLRDALDEIVGQWSAETGREAVVSYAGSSALARQIRLGAPADVFVSANEAWMDALEADGLIEPASRRDIVGNRLVLVSADPAAPRIEIGPGLDLPGMLGDGRLAMALVDAVPAGIYGKAALTQLGLWERVAPQVAQADNVRAALALVARGEAPLGIVYATDAAAEPGVRIVGSFPEATHPPIVYPVAAVAGTGPEASRFVGYLAGPEAQATFARHGFVPLD